MLFTSGLNLVTQTEQFSNAVASYNITGGAFNFLTHAALDTTSRGPLSQASISHFLLVESYLTGTISACQLATTGARSCVLVATLTTNGSSRTPAGIGVITA
ncbi:MAG: hypothetical protein M3Z66_13920 [Chloroflexota bacterium]|nr:hypothetical protein [Chloroflexota bacterium]